VCTVDACLAHLTAQPAVIAVCRCGSHRQGTVDAFSDLDIWVFCNDETPLSEQLALTDLLPAEARQEVLFEGRDDSLVEHLVVNVLTRDIVLNLKFLHQGVLTRFCAQPLSCDPGFLEDLENYATMQVLHDPLGAIAVHQAWLDQYAVRTAQHWLAPELVSRYATLYWRSVYQGVLRDEQHAWRHLAINLVELLACLAHLAEGHLPPPRKWLFSPRLLQGVPGGGGITTLLDRLWDVRTRQAVLEFYAELAGLEDQILDADLGFGFWWRSVFTRRIPNLAVLTDLDDLLTQINAAAIPSPRP
jgi:predicted nucleotidyltransferase